MILYWKNWAIRLATRLGIASSLRRLNYAIKSGHRADRKANRKMLKQLEPSLQAICDQLSPEIRRARGVALLISFEGINNIISQLPLVAGIVGHGLEPVVLLPSRASEEQKRLYKKCGVRRFAYWDEGGLCKDGAATLLALKECESQADLLALTWHGIPVGKFLVSTLMRRYRLGSVSPNDLKIASALYSTLERTLDQTHAAEKILDQWSPELVIFIDRGYTPEGPMFEACIQRGIRPATMNAAHRDNALILKRYDRSNSDVHPVSLSQKSWKAISEAPRQDEIWSKVSEELENCYGSGQWYGEVATQFNTQLLHKADLFKRLKLDPNKRTVILFPHIFWDATFFWGKDVFDDYQQWFAETLKHAWKNRSVNWIVKIHPANLVKNIRDKTNVEFSEIEEIKKYGEVPKHIIVLPVDTDISTHSLFKVADICLTVRGTVGIEAAAHGLRVVTAGTGRYDRLGFTKDVSTKQEYINLIKNIADLESPTARETELARRYAYGAFIMRPLETISINLSFAKTRTAELTVNISDQAQSDILNCEDVKAIKVWLDRGDEDTPPGGDISLLAFDPSCAKAILSHNVSGDFLGQKSEN